MSRSEKVRTVWNNIILALKKSKQVCGRFNLMKVSCGHFQQSVALQVYWISPESHSWLLNHLKNHSENCRIVVLVNEFSRCYLIMHIWALFLHMYTKTHTYTQSYTSLRYFLKCCPIYLLYTQYIKIELSNIYRIVLYIVICAGPFATSDFNSLSHLCSFWILTHSHLIL